MAGDRAFARPAGGTEVRRVQDGLQRDALTEVDRVADDDRLHQQFTRFVLAPAIGSRLGRKHDRIGEVVERAGRRPQTDSDRITIRILTIAEAVGADRHIIARSQPVEAAVQIGCIAIDREPWHRVEILRDGEIAVVVDQRIGDAEQIADRVFVEASDFKRPILVEAMPDLDQPHLAEQVRAGARLAITDPGRVDRRRQCGGAGGKLRRRQELAPEIHDRARQSARVSLVVAVVCFDDSSTVEAKVERCADQRTVQRAAGHVVLALAVQRVQTHGDPAVGATPAAIELLGGDPWRVVASNEPQKRRIRRPLQDVVEHTGRGLRSVQRSGEPVQNLYARKVFRRHGRGPYHVQSVDPGVLHDATLEAARLRA